MAYQREITCPRCGEKVEDKGKRGVLTLDWTAMCNCGWWRRISLPLSPKAKRDEMLSFIRQQVEIWDNAGDSGFPLYELGKRILARHPVKSN